MAQEGYSPEDMHKLEKFAGDRTHYLLNKSKKRAEHFNEDKYTLPKYFDQWRKWVAFKKIMRYQLNFVANRGEYLKADLASAFSAWKNYDRKQ